MKCVFLDFYRAYLNILVNVKKNSSNIVTALEIGKNASGICAWGNKNRTFVEKSHKNRLTIKESYVIIKT